MLLWYIETDLFYTEGVVMKRILTLVCLVLIAFSLAIIGFAHPGGTDGNGTTTTTNPIDIPLYSNCTYIDTENLEDVLESEFGDEYGEEIRDAIVYDSNTKLFEIYLTYYVEYESLWVTAMNQYGESITERIFSHPDLMILTGNDIIDKHGLKENDKTPEDDVTEYTEKTQITPKKQYGIEDVLYSILLLVLMGWGTLHIIQIVKNSK